MKYNIKNDIPQFYREDEDTEKILDVIQAGEEIVYEEITDLKNVTDYEKCEEKYLDLMLSETGFTPDIPLTILLKRKIIKNARKYKSLRGTNEGIVVALKELLGIVIEITNIQENTFRIGYSKIGGTEFIGTSQSALTFKIEHHETDEEKINNMKKLVSYMKWGLGTPKYLYKAE